MPTNVTIREFVWAFFEKKQMQIISNIYLFLCPFSQCNLIIWIEWFRFENDQHTKFYAYLAAFFRKFITLYEQWAQFLI